MGLEIHIKEDTHYTTLSLRGRLDAFSHNSLNEELQRLINNGHKQLILECSQLQVISSAGLRVLLTAVTTIDHQGKLVICGATGSVKSMIKTSGLHWFINRFTDLLSAQQALR